MLRMKFILLVCSLAFAWKPPNAYRGIAYKPVPKGVNPENSTRDFLIDSDLYNSDFTALWGVDKTSGVVSRNDLQTLHDDGFNTLHIFDWSSEHRDHIPFLDYCVTTGFKVFIPISNFIFLSDIDEMTRRDDENERKELTKAIVNSTFDRGGKIHVAVAGWLIGNEYELNNIPIEDIVGIIHYINDELDPIDENNPHNRPFGIPVSVADPLAPLQEIFDSSLSKDIFTNRLIYSMNVFFVMDAVKDVILDPYVEKFQDDLGGIDPIPLMFTEFNINTFNDEGEDAVKQEVHDSIVLIREWIVEKPSENMFNLVGFFFFEYTIEDFKGDDYEVNYGMHDLGDNMSPRLAATVNWAAGTFYAVNNLIPRSQYTDWITELKKFPIEDIEHIRPEPDLGSSMPSTGSIVGIAIAVGICLLIAAFCGFQFYRRRKRHNELMQQNRAYRRMHNESRSVRCCCFPAKRPVGSVVITI